MSAETRVPSWLGPYRLLESLGSGAMGEVFLAEDEGGRRVALKVLHPHLLQRRNFFRRFQREAHAGEAVHHPNVVRTYDAAFYVVDGVTWCVIATEYVEGRTLRDLLDDLGRVRSPCFGRSPDAWRQAWRRFTRPASSTET